VLIQGPKEAVFRVYTKNLLILQLRLRQLNDHQLVDSLFSNSPFPSPDTYPGSLGNMADRMPLAALQPLPPRTFSEVLRSIKSMNYYLNINKTNGS
jgi:hypothetical protein